MSELTFSRTGANRPGTTGTPVLELRALCVAVGIRRVIDGLDLQLDEGEGLCVQGPNGSGKSTLLNAIAGLEPARVKSGRILFLGHDITGSAPHERARLGLAFMRQRENVFPDLTIEENLHVALGQDGYERFCQAHPDWASALPPGKRAGILSGGQRQRLAWAMASLRACRLLLADEPEAGLSEPLPAPTASTYILVSHAPLNEAAATHGEEVG